MGMSIIILRTWQKVLIYLYLYAICPYIWRYQRT